MSCRPHGLGWSLPQGLGTKSPLFLLTAFSLNHATFFSVSMWLARFFRSSGGPPARQAYSHSASVGRRYFFPESCDSHLQ